MPELAGNLTTVSVTDADLLARYPKLALRYLPVGATDFAPQREVSRREALADFRTFTGKDPARCKAMDDAAWQRVLTLTCLVFIMSQSTDAASVELRTSYTREKDTVLRSLLFEEDANLDGTITAGSDDATSRVQEIRLWR